MCDYSLRLVASRPAKVGDKLISTRFPQTSTRGFASVDDLNVAVCLLPGTELAFENEVQRDTGLSFGWKLGHSVAKFQHVNKDQPNVHHDALELPDGKTVFSHNCARINGQLCCNYQRARRSQWTTHKRSIRLSNRVLLRSR